MNSYIIDKLDSANNILFSVRHETNEPTRHVVIF